jgi:hypothetical protein
MDRALKAAIYISCAVFATACLAISVGHAADASVDNAKKDEAKPELKVIPPEAAKDYEGQEVVVQFDVVSSRELGTGLCFLNSMAEFNDPAAFTVVISPKALSKFKDETKVDKPADFFKSKKVRVSGKVIVYQKDKDSPKKYEIKVDDPTQIKIVEAEQKKS